MSFLPDLLLFAIGFVIGAFGTLIGAGGGFLLVPILLLLYPNEPPSVITSISLAVIFLNAFSGSTAYASLKRIDFKSAIIFAIATLPGAIAGVYATDIMERKEFNTILGFFLILVASSMLFPKKKDYTLPRIWQGIRMNRALIDSQGHQYVYSYNILIGISISFVVGFLSSLLGIGGGIIHVPVLVKILNFPTHIATATSHLILTIMALSGTIVHVARGDFSHEWDAVLLIGIGAMLGAQLGARLSDKVTSKNILYALAIALLIVGGRIIFTK